MKFGRLTGLSLLLFVISVTVQSTVLAQVPAAAPPAGAADAVIKERLAEFLKAYNSRNAANLAEFFTDDATLIDVEGAVVRGKAEIGAQFATGFAQSSNYTLESEIESIRYITPDVVQIEGT